MTTGTAGILPASTGETRTRAGEPPIKSGAAVPVAALILPSPLRTQLAAEAAHAHPRECCGLIEGMARDDTIEAVTLHPTRNLAAEPDRFAIDPAAQVRLMRALRGSGRTIVGCYHSHPGGAAEPSARDREGAGEEDFVWLIAGLRPGDAPRLAAFVFAGGAFRPLPLLDRQARGPL